ncbi:MULTISPECIES: hypothetical protein [unclassified Enterococcus]|uniref:hypothetical protein n=1 Tax=unclassified Enterococcus TaxID=2608891 RepID=UPI00155714B4|nr:MULTISPECIES: hypothetical protein [unclassified Enterococcus]MBS7576549.1 hypothetical protein [Enterococcus sp. MMGLQ5-2]MBS7583964.1 hypothetical protein [Enterococcus sp. MMGLQ5-1]NPD11825.1 hypothetical protein [Enterococcus sp. MMGLQ5-1]NPD36386.1 hypothetical protein [Enterococcus sp. MMGLQ5-2]
MKEDNNISDYQQEMNSLRAECQAIKQELENLTANLSLSGKYSGIGMSATVQALRRQIKKL